MFLNFLKFVYRSHYAAPQSERPLSKEIHRIWIDDSFQALCGICQESFKTFWSKIYTFRYVFSEFRFTWVHKITVAPKHPPKYLLVIFSLIETGNYQYVLTKHPIVEQSEYTFGATKDVTCLTDRSTYIKIYIVILTDTFSSNFRKSILMRFPCWLCLLLRKTKAVNSRMLEPVFMKIITLALEPIPTAILTNPSSKSVVCIPPTVARED